VRFKNFNRGERWDAQRKENIASDCFSVRFSPRTSAFSAISPPATNDSQEAGRCGSKTLTAENAEMRREWIHCSTQFSIHQPIPVLSPAPSLHQNFRDVSNRNTFCSRMLVDISSSRRAPREVARDEVATPPKRWGGCQEEGVTREVIKKSCFLLTTSYKSVYL